jgi:glycolate oxidase iron-sulfur subunit
MGVQAEIDKCIQCGFCLQACPTYRLFDTEESSPRGRIARVKDIISGEVPATRASLATFGECLGCRACETACPSGVHYEEILMYGRAQLHARESPPPLPVRLLLRTIRHPHLLRLAKGVWRRIGAQVVRRAVRQRSSRPEIRLLASMPAPGPSPYIAPQQDADVALHRGCLMDIVWEGTNRRAVVLLRESGLTADLMAPSAGCCGAMHAHTGDLVTARRLAQRTIESFEEQGARYIVSLAGGCGAHIKEYPALFADDLSWRARAERLALAVRDIASLLVHQGFIPEPEAPACTYQDSCHLRNGLRVTKEPRQLLQGPAFRELPSADQCCGSAGVYNLLRPDVSGRILESQVAELRAMDVEELVTANPGCELQWRLGVREAGLSVRVTHLVDHVYERRADAGSDAKLHGTVLISGSALDVGVARTEK